MTPYIRLAYSLLLNFTLLCVLFWLLVKRWVETGLLRTKGTKKLYLCNENVCHSISFNRNSDKLWYVSSHLKILRKAPVMRGKL